MVQVLSNAWMAGVLGGIVGIALLLLPMLPYRFITPENAHIGIAAVAGGVALGLTFALVLLFGYQYVAPAGFPFFGFALIGGFLAALTVAAVKMTLSVLRQDDARR